MDSSFARLKTKGKRPDILLTQRLASPPLWESLRRDLVRFCLREWAKSTENPQDPTITPIAFSQMELGSVRAIESAAALKDDVSRSIYGFVRKEHRPVSRAEAAIYAGVSRKLAAWHLEKLVAKGLLEVVSSNGDGTHPVGRPAKRYSTAAEPIELSFPRKRHDLLAEVLAEAVESASAAESAREAALRLARARGSALGEGLRSQLNLRAPAPARAVKLAQGVLEKHGFEPVPEEASRVVLANCPFGPIAQRNPGLVCRMTQAFVAGLTKGLGAEGAEVVVDPVPGRCCVVLQLEAEAARCEA